jgi:hypothetical protein
VLHREPSPRHERTHGLRTPQCRTCEDAVDREVLQSDGEAESLAPAPAETADDAGRRQARSPCRPRRRAGSGKSRHCLR